MNVKQILNFGHIDASVLHLQEQHKSANILMGKDTCILKYQSTGKFLKNLTVAVWYRFVVTGFAGVVALRHMELDLALLTAIFEHWRPESHTFRLLNGESTITLQDVEMLTGLCVDGLLVTGQ